MTGRKLAAQIKNCFKEKEKMNRESFVFNEHQIKDSKGHEWFYPAVPIDKTIDKLNKLLEKICKYKTIK